MKYQKKIILFVFSIMCYGHFLYSVQLGQYLWPTLKFGANIAFVSLGNSILEKAKEHYGKIALATLGTYFVNKLHLVTDSKVLPHMGAFLKNYSKIAFDKIFFDVQKKTYLNKKTGLAVLAAVLFGGYKGFSYWSEREARIIKQKEDQEALVAKKKIDEFEETLGYITNLLTLNWPIGTDEQKQQELFKIGRAHV